jgi:hypothetical protein
MLDKQVLSRPNNLVQQPAMLVDLKIICQKELPLLLSLIALKPNLQNPIDVLYSNFVMDSLDLLIERGSPAFVGR